MTEWVSSNPAVQGIAGRLAAAFAKIEPKLKAELKSAYRAEADRNFKWLMGAAKDPKNEGHIGGDWWRYAKFDHDAAVREWRRTRKSEEDYGGYPANSLNGWETLRTYARFMSVDYHCADEDAVRAFDHARDSFILKNMRKIENVLGKREDVAESSVTFEFRRRVFEGTLMVRLADARFRADVGLKYVVRTVPRVTPYFQYPLLFTEAEAGGKVHRGPSEEELRVLLGGGPPKTSEQIRAEQGFCPASTRRVPEEIYRPVADRMSPYVRCPECGVNVSAKGGKYRTHMGKTAGRPV